MPHFSARAIFEALVNAVVHRHYSIKGSRIRHSIFSDRIEISSPGSLPYNLTVDTMGEMQIARNETLATLLSRMPIGDNEGMGNREYFVDGCGYGVPKILRDTQQICGKLPTYRLINEAELQLTIPAAENERHGSPIAILVYAEGKPMPAADVFA